MRRTCVVAVLAIVVACKPPAHEDETSRIRQHLAVVESGMRSAPPAGLSRDERLARVETLEWLSEYRRNGSFPHNHVEASGRVPVFVDPHGTPCAVGYLLLRSGEHDLVETIVRTDNLVRVRDLADDPGLRGWLTARGISLEEAAAIQPAYGYWPEETIPEASSSYAGVSIGASIISAAVASYALAGRGDATGRRWPAVLGVASVGFHSAMVGIAVGSDEDEADWAVGLNVLAGVFSAVGLADRWLARASGGGTGGGPVVMPFISGTGIGVSLVH